MIPFNDYQEQQYNKIEIPEFLYSKQIEISNNDLIDIHE
jgi:hypothetical protein